MASINEQPGVRLFDANDVNTLAQGSGHQTASAITAAGTTQATGTQLGVLAMQRVGTTAASTGVVLPSAQAGQWIMLTNDGANTLAVYGLGTDTINGTAGSTGVTQTTTQAALYFCCIAGKWNRVLTA